MHSLDAFAQAKLDDLQRRHLRRALAETVREDGIWVERDGKRLLSFSCNDYLNLTQHPAIKQAAIAAIEEYGAGSGASRLVTGNHPLYAELEARLARIKQTEAACVFGSGYLANAGIIPVLIGRDGSGAGRRAVACLPVRRRAIVARHGDDVPPQRRRACARIAGRAPRRTRSRADRDRRRVLDGRRSRAARAICWRLANEHDAWLMSDDAHGLGVVGGGRGSSFAGNTHIPVPLQMGTLSKAVGAYGGYLCASAPVIDLIRNRARTLIYSTGLPPACVAASIAALDLIEREPDYAALPVQKAKAFTRPPVCPTAQSPIVPVIVGDEEADARRLAHARRRRLSRRRHPPADGAGRHRALAA